MVTDGRTSNAVPAGEWHMYRRDASLTGRSPLPGRIQRPELLWSYNLGGSENECIPIAADKGRMDLLFTYGGSVLRLNGVGRQLWQSVPCGINAVGAVEDLDGDGRLEIVCSTGYEVIVLAAESGEILMRHYVGFPLSAGTQASTLLCHRFDTASRGMHLVAPLMSAKEVLVFDFRNGRRNGVLAHTLWMDDAFHPTVAAADMNNDGVDELIVSKLSGLYLFDVLSGTMITSARWTSNGERHRNYGLLQLVDINRDGTRDVVIVAERVARHLAALQNDGTGNLSLLWDRFVEFIYPDDTTELRHTGNSVSDVDGDGYPELIVCLYNAKEDNRWWLEVIDPRTGAVKCEMADRYLWGVQDIDGDGIPELLIGEEHLRNPLPFSTIEVVRMREAKPVTIWKREQARFAGRSLRPSGWKSNFRPQQFGHDETWTDTRGRAVTLFVFHPSRTGTKCLTEVTWLDGSVKEDTTDLASGGEFVMSALADVDGDGSPECILSENNGRILVGRANGKAWKEWRSGFRLQLEGFSAARPGPVPVVYRSPKNAPPCIAVPDNTWTIHQLQIDAGRRQPKELWKRPGRGWMGYDNAFHAPYVFDVDGDGVPEIMAVNPERKECSELLALSSNGSVKQSWLFTAMPPPAPTRIGLYEWVVTGANGKRTIAASAYRSTSMNSEQTIAIDTSGNQLWNRVEYGEGEWGRGVGPWSASSVVPGPGDSRQVLFLAKDLLCRLDAATGEWIREPWILWRATNSVMNQPEWDFTKDRQADFGTEKDPFTAYGSPIIIDADNDGTDEILVAGCFGGYGVLRDDYSILWWKRTPFTDMMLRLPGIADISGNGRLALGVCRSNGTFICVDAATGAELWSLDLGATTADIASCDIDGDGREEFVAGTTDGRLLAIGVDASGHGGIRWSYSLGTGLGNPVIADADGDGFSEILVVCGDGRLVCIGKGS